MLHAAPLLALAGLYGLVTVLLAVSLLRERRSSTLVVGICLLFALVAVGSAALAALTLAGHDPIEDEPFWLVLAGSAALAVPGVIVSSAATIGRCWRRRGAGSARPRTSPRSAPARPARSPVSRPPSRARGPGRRQRRCSSTRSRPRSSPTRFSS